MLARNYNSSSGVAGEMKSKKRPAECFNIPEPTSDNIEADHELFLQAFESKGFFNV